MQYLSRLLLLILIRSISTYITDKIHLIKVNRKLKQHCYYMIRFRQIASFNNIPWRTLGIAYR